MSKNQTKGIIIIIGGILSIFILQFLLGLIGRLIYSLSHSLGFLTFLWNLKQYYIFYIIACIIVIIGIKSLITKDEPINVNEIDIQTNKFINIKKSENMENKVINVTLVGGIIGALSSSPVNRLNNAIQKANSEGWKVAGILEASSGNLFLALLRLIILLVTVFLYTPTNGYYIVLEKPKNV
ncbi:MAG TPA: hypothetical protein PKK00_10080 [Bacteroidales bacterium]|nr:hypothetical protein [Bacteroidales bacterium]HPS17684.1 hypothetical protein [Bacteroidales bacterium]